MIAICGVSKHPSQKWYHIFVVTRRHRVFEKEIPYIALLLAEKIATKPFEDIKYGEGQALFKVLWRLKEHRPGHPSYPELTPGIVMDLIEEIRSIFGEYHEI